LELKNKRVLVVGLGKSGMAAALFLRDKGARVTVSDSRSAVALAGEIPALLDAGIMVETGGHGLLTFRRQDLIVVRHAGVEAGAGAWTWRPSDHWRVGAG
jgi:UDP-N-acetylmuramoylalanine--D-glutamate ligase